MLKGWRGRPGKVVLCLSRFSVTEKGMPERNGRRRESIPVALMYGQAGLIKIKDFN